MTDDGDVSPLLVDVSTWRHDLISPLPGAPQHDILIMKLTAAKKNGRGEEPGHDE